MTTDWFFPSTQGGQEYGINDAGIAWFSDGEYASFAREVLQNSLDAADGSDRPVRVTFRLLRVPRGDLPQLDALGEVVNACRDYTKRICKTDREFAENGKAQFDQALGLLSSPTLPVLLVRDENTTGLEGGDREKNGAWDRLVRQQGAPSMHGAGGGSYGIGQRAPFTVSGLRTIFYGTRTPAGVCFIGKSIWRSFPDSEGDIRQHIGFWGKRAAKGVAALTEDASIPRVFRRESVGCDLFIAGFQADPDWHDLITDAIIENFFAAIVGGRLEVAIEHGGGESTELSAASIAPVLQARLAAAAAAAKTKGAQEDVRRGLGRTRFWLQALTAPPEGATVFETQHAKLGRMHLYVARHPEAPCRVAFMRKPRILVFDQSNRALAGYAAVFICESEEGNQVLRTFELPDHRSWTKKVPGRDAIMRELYAFVRQKLESLATQESSEAQDVPDLARYLPEDEPELGQKGGALKSTGTAVSEPETGKLEQPNGRAATRARRRVARPPMAGAERDGQVDDDEEGEEAGTSSGGEGGGSQAEGAGGGDGERQGGESGTGSGQRDGPVPGAGRPGSRYPALRPTDLTFRAYYSESGTERGMRVLLRSRRRGSADCILSAAGEDTSYPIQIASVEEVTPEGRVPVVAAGNRLRSLRFERNQLRVFLLQARPDRRFAISLEVENAS